VREDGRVREEFACLSRCAACVDRWFTRFRASCEVLIILFRCNVEIVVKCMACAFQRETTTMMMMVCVCDGWKRKGAMETAYL
jgi:hypothetical protein